MTTKTKTGSKNAGSYRRGVFTPPVVSERDAEIARAFAAEILASVDRMYADGDHEAHRTRNAASWDEVRAAGPAIDYEVRRLIRRA